MQSLSLYYSVDGAGTRPDQGYGRDARKGSQELLIRRKFSRSMEKLGSEAALVSAISYIIIHPFFGKRGKRIDMPLRIDVT